VAIDLRPCVWSRLLGKVEFAVAILFDW
jgi:hypothetical protein